jgi:tRNA(fMet)-specific endonuclease VapC
MVMLDTDTCSELVMGDTQLFSRLDSLDRDSWCISSLVFAELQFGLEKGKLNPRSRDSLQRFLGSAPCVTFDCAAAQEGAMVRGELERQGRPASQMDYLIAGHARSLGSTLVTGNTRHFENVGGLRVENWISSR